MKTQEIKLKAFRKPDPEMGTFWPGYASFADEQKALAFLRKYTNHPFVEILSLEIIKNPKGAMHKRVYQFRTAHTGHLKSPALSYSLQPTDASDILYDLMHQDTIVTPNIKFHAPHKSQCYFQPFMWKGKCYAIVASTHCKVRIVSLPDFQTITEFSFSASPFRVNLVVPLHPSTGESIGLGQYWFKDEVYCLQMLDLRNIHRGIVKLGKLFLNIRNTYLDPIFFEELDANDPPTYPKFITVSYPRIFSHRNSVVDLNKIQ